MSVPAPILGPAPELHFYLSPRLTAAIADVAAFFDGPDRPARPPALGDAEMAALRALNDASTAVASSASRNDDDNDDDDNVQADRHTISTSLLRPLSAGLLFLTRCRPTASSLAPKGVAGYVHELVQGASIAPVRPTKAPGDEYPPEVVAALARTRARVARREVDALLGKKRDQETSVFSGFSHVTKDLSIAMNVIMMMVTGYFAMWYVGTMLFPHNRAFQMGFGAVGVVGALIVETALLVIRDHRKEEWERAQDEKAAVTALTTAKAGKKAFKEAIKKMKEEEGQAAATGGATKGERAKISSAAPPKSKKD